MASAHLSPYSWEYDPDFYGYRFETSKGVQYVLQLIDCEDTLVSNLPSHYTQALFNFYPYDVSDPSSLPHDKRISRSIAHFLGLSIQENPDWLIFFICDDERSGADEEEKEKLKKFYTPYQRRRLFSFWGWAFSNDYPASLVSVDALRSNGEPFSAGALINTNNSDFSEVKAGIEGVVKEWEGGGKTASLHTY